jgi:AraC family transcriptional regulator, arabinose operon regulatory protein
VKRSLPKKETTHPDVIVVTSDEFRVGARYDNWRSRGTQDWLLILTVAGAGRVGSGDTEILSTPGMVSLYQPNTPQRYYTDPAARHWHLLWSHFHPRPHWGLWLNWPEPTRGLKVISLHDQVVFRHVRAALADATRFSRLQLPGTTDLAVNALERALLWIHSVNNQATLDERVRHAVDLLEEGLKEPFSLARLASACGLSVSRLAHLFREQIGLPPLQYLEELRLQRAAQLLRSTGLRISEIAEEVGYEEAFYFSSRFRKKFGQPPSHYRQKK